MSLGTLDFGRCRFSDPATADLKTEVDAPTSTVAPTRKPTLTAVPSSFWISLYGLFLMSLIVLYFGLIAGAVIVLIQLEHSLVGELWPITNLWFLKVWVAFLLLVPITRLFTHFWHGVLGLITDRNDTAPLEADDSVLLDPSEHPSLYAVVADVSRKVASPVPDEIRLTFRPLCYAEELRTFGITTTRRLVLVIGLPQFEVMTLSELKVIIAHELAHFGGGDTRWGVFASRFLAALSKTREEIEDASWRWIDPVAWLSWVYFHLYYALSAPLCKHREFRADAYGAAAFGGEFSAQTLLKNWCAEAKFDEALQHFLHIVSRKDSKFENIFRDFIQRFKDFTPEGWAYLEDRLIAEEQDSFWDSHPTTAERMKAMRRYVDRELPEPLPSHLLLRDVDALEKKLQEQIDALQPAFPKNYLG